MILSWLAHIVLTAIIRLCPTDFWRCISKVKVGNEYYERIYDVRTDKSVTFLSENNDLYPDLEFETGRLVFEHLYSLRSNVNLGVWVDGEIKWHELIRR